MFGWLRLGPTSVRVEVGGVERAAVHVAGGLRFEVRAGLHAPQAAAKIRIQRRVAAVHLLRRCFALPDLHQRPIMFCNIRNKKE